MSRKAGNPRRIWSGNKLADALDAVIDGGTLCEVANAHGVSAPRMQQIVARATREALCQTGCFFERMSDDERAQMRGPCGMRQNAHLWKQYTASIRRKARAS